MVRVKNSATLHAVAILITHCALLRFANDDTSTMNRGLYNMLHI